jgi:hypothetical protein
LYVCWLRVCGLFGVQVWHARLYMQRPFCASEGRWRVGVAMC